MATFGKTDIGGSNTTTAIRIVGGHYAPANGNGTADSIEVYLNFTGATEKLKGALYEYVGPGDAGNLIANGVTDEITPLTGARWHVLPFSGTKPSVVDGTQYFIMWLGSETDHIFYYDSGGAAGINCYGPIRAYDGFTDPLINETASTAMRSIFCNYTPSGAGVSIPVAMHHYRNLRET